MYYVLRKTYSGWHLFNATEQADAVITTREMTRKLIGETTCPDCQAVFNES